MGRLNRKKDRKKKKKKSKGMPMSASQALKRAVDNLTQEISEVEGEGAKVPEELVSLSERIEHKINQTYLEAAREVGIEGIKTGLMEHLSEQPVPMPKAAARTEPPAPPVYPGITKAQLAVDDETLFLDEVPKTERLRKAYGGADSPADRPAAGHKIVPLPEPQSAAEADIINNIHVHIEPNDHRIMHHHNIVGPRTSRKIQKEADVLRIGVRCVKVRCHPGPYNTNRTAIVPLVEFEALVYAVKRDLRFSESKKAVIAKKKYTYDPGLIKKPDRPYTTTVSDIERVKCKLCGRISHFKKTSKPITNCPNCNLEYGVEPKFVSVPLKDGEAIKDNSQINFRCLKCRTKGVLWASRRISTSSVKCPECGNKDIWKEKMPEVGRKDPFWGPDRPAPKAKKKTHECPQCGWFTRYLVVPPTECPECGRSHV